MLPLWVSCINALATLNRFITKYITMRVPPSQVLPKFKAASISSKFLEGDNVWQHLLDIFIGQCWREYCGAPVMTFSKTLQFSTLNLDEYKYMSSDRKSASAIVELIEFCSEQCIVYFKLGHSLGVKNTTMSQYCIWIFVHF